jgi:prepilin-type N-terminal cleavage/methylation domain-containing protein
MKRVHSPCRTSADDRPQSGFTLIEVLVALGLSLVLISAIYSAISLHWRFETAGRERIERAQISLAVLRLMTEDIGSVAFKAPGTTEESAAADTGTATTGSSSSGSLSSSSPTDTSTSASTSMSGANSKSTTSASTPTSHGIVGTADYIQLDISRPAREDLIPEQSVNGPTTAAPVQPVLSNNVRVTWGMVTPSMASVDAKGIRDLTANPALARQMADRLREVIEVQAVETTQNTAAPILEESSILAREIVSLSLRYFDGYSWTTEWDSVTAERLPRAIEVTIGFLKPEHRKPGALNLPGSETIVPIKHVILVPSSSPVSGEEL